MLALGNIFEVLKNNIYSTYLLVRGYPVYVYVHTARETGEIVATDSKVKV